MKLIVAMTFAIIFSTIENGYSQEVDDKSSAWMINRVWRDSTNSFSVEARLVKVDGTKVKLLRVLDKTSIDIDISQLCAEDRKFVADFRRETDATARLIKAETELSEFWSGFRGLTTAVDNMNKAFDLMQRESLTSFAAMQRYDQEFAKHVDPLMGKPIKLHVSIEDVRPSFSDKDVMEVRTHQLFLANLYWSVFSPLKLPNTLMDWKTINRQSVIRIEGVLKPAEENEKVGLMHVYTTLFFPRPRDRSLKVFGVDVTTVRVLSENERSTLDRLDRKYFPTKYR